jgi:hypothetical protein
VWSHDESVGVAGEAGRDLENTVDPREWLAGRGRATLLNDEEGVAEAAANRDG